MSIVRPMMRSLMRVGKLTPGGGAAYEVHPNLVLDMPFSGNLRDYISGQYLTLNRSGELVAVGSDGNEIKSFANHPVIDPRWGVFTDGAGTQYFVNPHDPVTQTINLGSTGNYCLWVSGSGSATIAANSATIDSGGEATDGSYVTLEVTDTGTVDVTIDGDLDWCQLEDGTFPSSRIYNDGTPGDDSTSSRATQAADSSGNGLRIPFDDLDPRVKKALGSEGDGEGTLICTIRPEFPDELGFKGYVAVDYEPATILYSSKNKYVRSYDGTNSTIINSSTSQNVTSHAVVRWSSITSTLETLVKREDETSWRKDSNDFDGAFQLGEHLNIFYDNPFPMWLRNLKIYNKALSDDEIKREANK